MNGPALRGMDHWPRATSMSLGKSRECPSPEESRKGLLIPVVTSCACWIRLVYYLGLIKLNPQSRQITLQDSPKGITEQSKY